MMTFEKKDYSEGSVSEWNEGNFKNLRLHEAQEMINQGKINPFSMNEERTTWNFLIWKAGIDILFGEGCSKYSEEEVVDVEKIKNMVDVFISIKTPFKKITEHSFGGVKDKFIPVKENQIKIRELLENYEKVVKKFNDLHGLSTRNVDEDDWRGL